MQGSTRTGISIITNIFFRSSLWIDEKKKKTLLRYQELIQTLRSRSVIFFIFFLLFFSRESHNSLVVAKWHNKYKWTRS